MRISLSRHGLYVVLRLGTETRDAQGFVIKPCADMVYSERCGHYKRQFALGPLFFRTYARRRAA